jgi:hypothetical protein
MNSVGTPAVVSCVDALAVGLGVGGVWPLFCCVFFAGFGRPAVSTASCFVFLPVLLYAPLPPLGMSYARGVVIKFAFSKKKSKTPNKQKLEIKKTFHKFHVSDTQQ